MRDPWATRVIGAVIGAFYLVTGAWAFLAPLSFFSAVATFAPSNIHLLHDVGAFQVGLGLALTVPVALRAPLRVPLIAVLGASVLHVFAHVEDISLGGRPTSDLPVLTLICVALVFALVVEVRAKRA
ncbi:MAG TPA: hypothetical protein VIP78_03165 [Candidatus Dormibacteraeota bacterium]|jgi:hypothetical protein